MPLSSEAPIPAWKSEVGCRYHENPIRCADDTETGAEAMFQADLHVRRLRLKAYIAVVWIASMIGAVEGWLGIMER